MALIWADGFDHYGPAGQEVRLLDGAYAEQYQVFLNAANPRSGTRHLRFQGAGAGSGIFRHAFKGGAVTQVGCGYSMFLSNLPTQNNNCVTQFHDGANIRHVYIDVTTTGVLRAMSYNGTVLYQTPAPVITANAHYHIEAFVKIDAAAGIIKVNVNEQTVINLAGINTRNPGAAVECSQIIWINNVGYGGPTYWDFDDLYIYDTNGTINAAFPIGDMRVLLEQPNADTAQADFTKSSGVVGFSLINENNPNDADYIQSTAVGQKSDFDLTDLPVDITYIAGLFLHTRAVKSDAGPAQIKASVVSNAIVTAGADRPITTIGTYWYDAIERDPNTAARWTRLGVNAARVRYERTV